MTNTPTITFECIGCGDTELIKLERYNKTPSGYETWIVPDPWECDWTRNEAGQLICQDCHTDYPEPERTETLSAAERNPGLADKSKWS